MQRLSRKASALVGRWTRDVRRARCSWDAPHGGLIGNREWARRNERLADIHTLDDRYDHDVDELMA